MSTKTSPTTSSVVNVKREVTGSDEIKDIAETAMNELLGWYGYDLDRNIIYKNGRIKDTINNPNQHDINSKLEKYESNERPNQMEKDLKLKKRIPHSTDSINYKDDNSVSSISSQPNNNPNKDNECGWCRNSIAPSQSDFMVTPDGSRYCSEPCFAHSRRASFKRAKTCDWCKHIRHTVSYVDFNDGATQLQFCSDKCLNQYKMQIFCKETQAHLDMNPHLKDNFKTSDNLITPELWLRNCKSRSVSPDTERSQSPPKDSVASHLFPSPPSMIESIASKSTRPTNCSGSYSPSMRPVSRKRFLRTTINRLMNEAESNSNRQRSGTNKTAPTVIAKPQGHQESHNITSDLPKKTTFPSIMHPMQPRNNIQPPSFLPNRNFNHPLFGANMPFIPSPMNYNFMDALRPTILGSMQPPVTVLVPHPVIIPLPIPIPIPMPLEAFLKAAQSRVVKEEETTKVVQTEIDDMELDESKESVELEEINEPLDCSKSAPSQPLDVRVNDKPKEIISNDERVLTRRSSSAIIVNPSSSKETEINRPLRKRKRLMNYSCTSRATYSNPTLSTEK